MILIADDDPLYDEDLKTILGLEGYKEVCIAKTCKAMLELVSDRGHPEAIVLDMMLPWDEDDAKGGTPPDRPEELRGLRAAQELKDADYDPHRVVVITAFHSEPANQVLRNLGIFARNILLKPARTREILSRIRDACNVRRT